MSRLRVLASAFACSPPGTPGFTGGESLLGWNLIRQLARFNEVWVLTYGPDRQSIEQYLPEENALDLHFIFVSLPSWLSCLLKIQGGHQFYYYMWQVKAYFVARGLNRKVNFNIFHHVTYANDWMASFIGALLPIPYLRGPGGGAQKIPRGFLRLDTLRGRFSEHCRTAGQWFFKHDPFFIIGQNRARTLLICNPEAMEAIPKKWRSKARLFPVNGVASVDFYQEPPTTPPDTHFRIITAGKLIPLKGFDLAIKAFELFHKKHVDSSLTIVGDGPELRRLVKMVKDAGLEEHVIFEKWMTREKLLGLISYSDVFLFSGLRDGGGAVVVEAMSQAKPIVCLDIGGPAMHVDDECGFKITATTPLDSAVGMAEALGCLYSDNNLCRIMGDAGKKKALNFYHWDRSGDRLKAIYDNIISRCSN